MKIKTKERTMMKECCRECGFPIDMERKPVFLTKNSLDLLEHERNKCQTCGHQKSGWTIPCVYEHIQKVLKTHKEKSITKEKIKLAIDKLIKEKVRASLIVNPKISEAGLEIQKTDFIKVLKELKLGDE